jgi:integrase/recombinase XerC
MDYFQSFTSHLSFEKRRSRHTVEAYQRDLTQFFDFLKEIYEIDDPTLVDQKVVRSWVVACITNKLSPATIQRKCSALKTFYMFLVRRNNLKVNPMDGVVLPRKGQRIPTFIPLESIHHLQSELTDENNFQEIRNGTIIALLYGTGMRRTELLSLKMVDLDLSDMVVKVMGKRMKERRIPILSDTQNHLRTYISRRSDLPSINHDDFLFIEEDGRALSPRSLYRIVNQWLQRIPNLEQKSPHVLRHTYASHLAEKGADLNAIKELLGHASLAATQVYTHTRIDHLKKVHQNAHPHQRKRDKG